MNFIFCSLDTLRADRLGAIGNGRGLTPNLDRIASEGALFTQAFASDIPTQPSHTALFTGMYGVNTNIVSHFHPEALLEGDTLWMPTFMRRRGYATGAVDHLFSMKEWFKRGYNDYMPPEGRSRSPGSEINAIAFPWITEHADRDFFLFLHYWDAHIPYLPPTPFKERYTAESARRLDPATNDQLKSRPSYPLFKKNNYDFLGEIPNVDYIGDLYDAEVAYLDFEIGRLFDHLGDEGLLENTMVVLFGDHGENMTEHDSWFDHAGLYDSVTHVPLILWAPGMIPQIESPALVQLLDVFPTIGDILGAPQTKGLNGRSLMPLVRGETRNHRLYVMLSEATWQASRAVRTDMWKLIKHVQPTLYGRDGTELYRITDDPSEQHNVAALYPEVTENLSLQLDEWVADQLDGRPDPMQAVLLAGLPAVARLNEVIAGPSDTATMDEADQIGDLVPVGGAMEVAGSMALAESEQPDLVPLLSAPVADTTKGHRRRGAVVAAVVVGIAALLAVAVDNLVLSSPLSATGVVEPLSSAQLNMATSGPITSIPVKVGDVVQAGQVLATQDTSALQAKIAADTAQQTADQATLLAEQQGGSNPQIPTLNNQVAAAELGLAAAQSSRAQSAAASGSAVAGATAQVQADQSLVTADLAVAAANVGRCSVSSPPVDCSASQHQLQVDQAALASAQNAYQRELVSQSSSTTLGQSAVDKASADVAAAQAAATAAAAPASSQQIATTEAAVQRDQAAIASDTVAETQAVVKAPFAGVVSAINGIVGEIASPDGVRLPTSPSSVSQSNSTGIQLFPQGPQSQSSAPPSSASLISLDSLDNNFVVQVPESGISQVHIGQTAHITLPAFSGSSVPSKVVMIQPTPVDQAGTTYFLVHLESPAKALKSLNGGTGKSRSGFDQMAGFTVDASF